MAHAFDPEQPGAIRLRHMAREIKASVAPVAVEILKPVFLPDEDRHLAPGDRTTLGAGWADVLVEQGCAVRV